MPIRPATEFPVGAEDEAPGNQFDTDETVVQVGEFNAARDELCGYSVQGGTR